MTVTTIRPADLGAATKARAAFDPQQSCVPYREADQTYCNGGTFVSARALPLRDVTSEIDRSSAEVRDRIR